MSNGDKSSGIKNNGDKSSGSGRDGSDSDSGRTVLQKAVPRQMTVLYFYEVLDVCNYLFK
jgi:hypothetical protein